MKEVEILVVQTEDSKDLSLPEYETEGAAGLDLKANVDGEVVLRPGERTKVGTGLCVEIPLGYEIQVRPRSGLADKFGITVLNTPGTIDSDFRGEIKVLLINLGSEPFVIKRGDRIAQMVVNKFERANLKISTSLSETARGSGEFGSTGV